MARAHALWTADLVTATTNAALRNPEIALKMLSRRAKGWSERPNMTLQHTGVVGSYEAAPTMAQAVKSNPASNAAFLELLSKLSKSGAFNPGGPLSSAGPLEFGEPRDACKSRALQTAVALDSG
ncbi:MAG: hypothetical protein NVSMB64_00050 [Candidatus Velthaea sp.]